MLSVETFYDEVKSAPPMKIESKPFLIDLYLFKNDELRPLVKLSIRVGKILVKGPFGSGRSIESMSRPLKG